MDQRHDVVIVVPIRVSDVDMRIPFADRFDDFIQSLDWHVPLEPGINAFFKADFTFAARRGRGNYFDRRMYDHRLLSRLCATRGRGTM